ncbi:sensor histidine kinase [Lysinibacillus endophyticus]|uniref:sensor histidine kinase n=1 Tax=Ureibacillus endophyticus TaxID=1978490 RepID=UPI003135B8C7
MQVALDKRNWNWLDTFLFFMRTLWIYYNASYVIENTANYQNKWLIFLWFMAIYLVPLLFYRPKYMKLISFYIAETLITASMFFYMMIQFQMAGVYDFLYLPLIMIGYVCQVRPYLWIGMITSVMVFLTGTALGDQFTEHFISAFINTALFYMIGFSLGRITVINNKNKELIQSIQEKNKALEQYSRRIEELTIMEERNRVSQDLHDTVGHIFTSVITSLDALPFVMRANQQVAEEHIKEIADLARNGLNDVRKTIHQISPTESHLPLSQTFQEVVTEFMKHTGTTVDFKIEGNEREIGERIKFAYTRCLQEGLTNAIKHGRATQINVRLFFNEVSLLMEIKDNGIGFESISLGFGLQGMKDRMTALNGMVNINSKPNEGTELRCSIPLAKEVMLND